MFDNSHSLNRHVPIGMNICWIDNVPKSFIEL